MVEFFEPEDEFKLDKSYRRNIQTKITFFTALIVFGLFLILAVRVDFINFFKSDKIVESCFEFNSHNYQDDEELKLLKAQRVLTDHMGTLKELDGFKDVSVGFDEIQRERKIPVINLLLRKTSTDKKRVPERICGFQVIIKNQ